MFPACLTLPYLFSYFRFLDDVAVHHLIDALCRLLSESADSVETSKVGYARPLQERRL